MARVGRIVLGCSLAYMVGIVQLANADPQSSPYISRLYGFTLQPPPGWNIEERSPSNAPSLGQDIVLIATEKSPAESVGFNVNVTVAVRNIPDAKRLNDPKQASILAAGVLDSLAVADKHTIQTIEQNGLVGAQRQFQYIQNYPGGQLPLFVSVTALVSTRHGHCFLITGTAPASLSEKYQPIFRDLVASFGEIH